MNVSSRLKYGGETRVVSNDCRYLYQRFDRRLLVTRCMVFFYSKWRTTPVVGEAFAEVLAQVVAVGAADAAEAVEGAAVPGAASPRTRK